MPEPHRIVTDIIERRDESKKWLRKNLWDELATVWQAIKCKTSPVYKTDEAGNETKEEDRARTNVAMPDLNIIYRRNAARMTAQPYRLRYTGGQDPTVPDRLSAMAMQQYARSNEAYHDVRLMLAAEGLGYAYTKLYWDKLERMMVFRRAIVKNGEVVYRDRASIMRAEGAPADEISHAVAALGTQMSDDELAIFMGKSGNEVSVPTDVKKYEGPVVKWVFNGNLFLEPYCLSIDQSDYIIEQYRESDLWLKKMSKLTYEDPDTGEIVKAFDGDAINELLAMEPDIEVRPDELRDMFFAATGKQDEQQYRLPKNLRVRKKYDLLEQHAQDDDDGRMWITWVSEKFRDKPIGRMPYPWDLYGKSTYTELIPLPDLMSCYGDSTPRLLRHLYSMHNLIVAQNFDYVTNLLKPFILKRAGTETKADVVIRGMFRELVVNDINGIKPLQEPPLPSGAFEREAQVMRMMSIAEPALTTVDAGTSDNPNAGRTATTALLASKASDALTQFKFEARNRYLRELGMKKLWMNQQAAEDAWEVEKRYLPQEMLAELGAAGLDNRPQWALSDRNDRVVAVRLDPQEIQEDFEVEPEAGSYLAVDDELRQDAATRLEAALQLAPGVLDPAKVIRFHLNTIRGIGNPDDFFAPPQPPQPPIKGNVNFSVPLDKMPADIINQILPLVGMEPSKELEARDQANQLTRASQMADAADNMLSPGQHEQDQDKMLHEASQQGAEMAHTAASKLADQAHQHSMQINKAGLDSVGVKQPGVRGMHSSNGSKKP